MLQLPGIPWDGAPVGPDESANTVVRTEGTPPKFTFEPLDHVALIEKNDWADLSRITEVSGSRTYCLKGRLALLETKLMAWALETIAGPASRRSPCRRWRASKRSSTRAIPRPPGGNLRDRRRRSVAGRDRRSRADVAPFGRDPRRRQTADPLRRLLALLPPRGGQRRQGRARAAARPPVRQGRAICDLRGRRSAVRRMARQAARAGREPAAGARDPLPGDRDVDRRHGAGQVSHERHRELGAKPGQVSRDP